MSLLLRLEALTDRVGAAVCGMGPDLDVLCGAAALLIVVDAVAYVAADAGFMAFFQGRFLLSGADIFSEDGRSLFRLLYSAQREEKYDWKFLTKGEL